MEKTESKKLNVLVVEDETIIAINICNSLQQFGYTANYTNTGESALEMVDVVNYDIILMDIMLGDGLDGIETAKEIQKKRSIPVVYLTAYSDQETLDRAQITEPSGYIIKPFHARELYIAIELAIYKSRASSSMKIIQDRLYESQRMESIGLLASGIAHEINNPLMGIVNFSILGLEKSESIQDEELVNFFQIIQEESEKISLIVKNLINYAREDRDHWIWADLNLIVEEILSLFHQLFIKENISIDWKKNTNISAIYCKPQKLKQAFLNIISFCRVSILSESVSEKKWIHIKLDEWEDDPHYVSIDFMDSGNGIQNQLAKKIVLDPYDKNFSLAGLGFHISESIALEHDGKIFLDFKESKDYLRILLPKKQSKS